MNFIFASAHFVDTIEGRVLLPVVLEIYVYLEGGSWGPRHTSSLGHNYGNFIDLRINPQVPHQAVVQAWEGTQIEVECLK